MTHKMILMSHDFKEVKAVVVVRRKEHSRRVSSEARTSDSYPENSGSTPLPGSTFEERE